MRYTVLCLALLLVHSLALSASGEPRITRTSVGPVERGSSLAVEWVVINDDTFPVTIGPTGVKVYGLVNTYSCKEVALAAKDSLHAFEVRFLLLDVWGSQVHSLSALRVEDINAGELRKMRNLSWSRLGDAEEGELWVSIAYVARVRLQSGKVVNFDERIVQSEAKRIAAELQPTQ